jgi:predicted phosphohydrolase
LRLALVSDLHVDISQKNWELVPQLAELAKIIDPEVFIVCGDISPELGDVEYALDCFSALGCVKLFIPGNQDIWVLSDSLQEQGHDSYEKYFFHLPQICRRNGFVPLWMEPQVIRGVGFAGSIGWYDFTFREDDLAQEPPIPAPEDADNHVWNDLRWACWNDISSLVDGGLGPYRRPDVEVARDFIARLEQDLQTLERIPGVEEIVVALHHPPFPQLLEGSTARRLGEYCSFLGSQEMGKMLLRHVKVTTVLCGHLHEARDLTVERLRLICSPVGYLAKDRRKNLAIAEEALTVFHLLEGEDLLLL